MTSSNSTTTTNNTNSIESRSSEGDSTDNSGLSFLSWIQSNVTSLTDTVKKKTEVAVNVYKRDLAEFVDTVQRESKEKIDEWSHILKDEVPDDDTNVLNPSSENSTHSGVREANSGDLFSMFTSSLGNILSGAVQITPAEGKRRQTTTIFDRKSARIVEIRKTPQTYLQDPKIASSTSEQYLSFRKSFLVSQYASAIAKILAEDNTVVQLMDRIVPSQASYDEFWARYFFRVQEVDYEEEQRKKIIIDNTTAEEENITWDSDEEIEKPTSHAPSHQHQSPLPLVGTSELLKVSSPDVVEGEATNECASPTHSNISQSSPFQLPKIDVIKDVRRDSPTSQTEDWTNVDTDSSARVSADFDNQEDAAISLHGTDDHNPDTSDMTAKSLTFETANTTAHSKEEEDWANWE